MSKLRKQLESQARAHLDACERDLIETQKRLLAARLTLAYIKTGKPVGDCPTPLLNEVGAQAERFAARVDALLHALYVEEGGEEG